MIGHHLGNLLARMRIDRRIRYYWVPEFVAGRVSRIPGRHILRHLSRRMSHTRRLILGYRFRIPDQPKKKRKILQPRNLQQRRYFQLIHFRNFQICRCCYLPGLLRKMAFLNGEIKLFNFNPIKIKKKGEII
jgi:hypothetical protein